MTHFDLIVLGGGAAGLMCARTAAQAGSTVCVIERSKNVGEKIRISGGGRCNFTNIHCSHRQFLSKNPHFMKSALKQYSQYDFIAWMDDQKIAYHEKALGQLFCDGKATQIVDLFIQELCDHGVTTHLNCNVQSINRSKDGFLLATSNGNLSSSNLVVATGGKSIPAMGATSFGYEVAQQFGLSIVETRPALVPLTLTSPLQEELASLAGVSCNARVSHQKTSFDEALLFTHRGLSGPSILQISSYWREGDEICLNLCPSVDWGNIMTQARTNEPRKKLGTVLGQRLPARLVEKVVPRDIADKNCADHSNKQINELVAALSGWTIKPAGSEGYRTAEVTLGGVNTDHLNSKTMEVKTVPGLYFIGEVVDVTGWLGGYNFQWAWSSGYAAGTAIAEGSANAASKAK